MPSGVEGCFTESTAFYPRRGRACTPTRAFARPLDGHPVGALTRARPDRRTLLRDHFDVQRRERHDADVVGVRRSEAGGELQGQSRLATATGAGINRIRVTGKVALKNRLDTF